MVSETYEKVMTVVVGIVMLVFLLNLGLNTKGEEKAHPAQIDVLVQTDGGTIKSEAFSTLEEAEKFSNCVYSDMDVTGWGRDYLKCEVTLTANYQNIISVKQPNAVFLTNNFGWHVVAEDELEFITEMTKESVIEPWINATKNPDMLLIITLEDGTLWYVCIHNT